MLSIYCLCILAFSAVCEGFGTGMFKLSHAKHSYHYEALRAVSHSG